MPESSDHGPGSRPDDLRMVPTSSAFLAVLAAVGLVLGWLVHPLSESWRGTAPVVTWAQPAALGVVAVIIGTAARMTWRSVQVRRERLDARAAVNRLALGRAGAYVGALIAGGYAGYAVSWLGHDTDLATQRVWRSAASAAVAVVIVVTGLLLERACRVPADDRDL